MDFIYDTQEFGISILLPVYNAATTIKECIDSILTQSYSQYELLIADEDSTDNTSEIISSYHDARISLIKCEPNHVMSLNRLLQMVKGKYIVRMDANYFMSKHRLLIQYNYMEAYPEISAAGGNIRQIGKNSMLNAPLHISDIDFTRGCCIHPTTAIIRTTNINKHHLRYDESYASVADYALFCDMLCNNLKLSNINATLVENRQETECGNNNATSLSAEEERLRTVLSKWIWQQEEIVKQDYETVPVSGNKLSACITFLNEGEEVGKTVREIRRTVGKSVEIIIVNDASDDNYNYEVDLRGMDVHYVVNKRRIGAAAGKEKAVQISSTPYILLLDAHMRFYTTIWAKKIVEEIEKTPDQLLCCLSEVLKRDEKGHVYDTERININGAYMRFSYDSYIPKIKWMDTQMKIHLKRNEVPAILGACYCCTKEYWNRLKGVQGLIHYGCEEEYLSIKAWMEGGGCRLIKNVVIGHVYRKHAPYNIVSLQRVFNHIVIIETLFPTSERAWGLAVARKQNIAIYNCINALLKTHCKQLQQLKDYYKKTFISNRFSFIRSINQPQLINLNTYSEQIKMAILQMTKRTKENIGLFQGIAGDLLAVTLYANMYKDIDINLDSIIQNFLQKIECIESHSLSAYLEDGWAGIGWSLVFIFRHHLCTVLTNKYFNRIDLNIMESVDFRITGNSFEKGIGGILAYVVSRFGMLTAFNESNFQRDFLHKLAHIAQIILSDSTTDFRTYSYALQFLECMKEKRWEILPPRIVEIVDLPTSIQQNEKFSQDGLKGMTGYILYLLEN